MPPKPDRTALRERYDRRQAQVVLDAARVFARQGYDQTSVPQLADELGLAAGSLYHYFGGKEQLLIAICDELMDPLLDEARAIDGQRRRRGDASPRARPPLGRARHRAPQPHARLPAGAPRHRPRRPVAPGPRATASEFERAVQSVLERVEPRRRGPSGRRAASRSPRCWAWSTTPPSGTGRAAASAPTEIADGYVALIVAALSALRPRRRLDFPRERVDVVGALVAAAVDEERGRARHAAGVGALDVTRHPRRVVPDR